jgi:16S rRNA (uracil1498-N3)-methyltransferase
MPRFYLPPSQLDGERFRLSDSEAHHALHVLRKKVGDELDLFDGKDRAFRGRIDRATDTTLEGTILSVQTSPPRTIELWLFAALIKGPRWDWLVQKACEVGVDVLVPITTARTIVQLEGKEISGKLERWQRISMEAAKQCGRSGMMDVRAPQPFMASVTQAAVVDSLLLLPWEKENQSTLREACAAFPGGRVCLWVGPEGGWEEDEARHALTNGAHAVTLGKNLLRSETACIVAAALVEQEFFKNVKVGL